MIRSAAGLFALAFVSCSSPLTRFDDAVASASAQAMDGVDRARLQRSVEDIYAARRAGDAPASPWYDHWPLSREPAREWVDRTATSLGYDVRHERSTADGISVENLVFELPGREAPDELVLVSGHYDAWFSAGADDNASALAAMLDVARVAKTLAPPRRTIRFVAFDYEEEGMIGANRYFQAHASDRVRVLLNMDCVGYASHQAGSQSAPTGFALRDTGDFLLAIANAPAESALEKVVTLGSRAAGPTPTDVVGLLAPGDGHWTLTEGFLRSDHAPFWRAKVPSIFFTDTADYRNANYHTDHDTPETLDWDYLDSVTRIVGASALAFANEP